MAKITQQDKKWQAEADARTLAEAEEIKRSASRRQAAVRQAKQLAKDAQKQVQNLKKVARAPRKKK
jgi:hypothetical protein